MTAGVPLGSPFLAYKGFINLKSRRKELGREETGTETSLRTLREEDVSKSLFWEKEIKRAFFGSFVWPVAGTPVKGEVLETRR